MPTLGVSSLDLGRLWQRKRPLFLVYFPLSLFTADLSFAWKTPFACQPIALSGHGPLRDAAVAG
jgi:hypothetical protein